MDMQEKGRYCRYHEAPQRRKTTLSQRIKAWSWTWRRKVPQEGRKRILPGHENTNLGAGWNRVDPQK